MANRNAEDVVTKPATDTAVQIEKAVRTNDKPAYDSAMSEVNKFRDTHTPAENRQYTAAITKRLEDDKVLPTVSLFEAQKSFDKIDIGGNNKLEKGELDLYKHRDDVNELQKAFITNIQDNYEKIKDINQYGERWYGGNSNSIHRKDIDAGVKEQQAQLNLYAPDKNGKEFVDTLRDKTGAIPHGTIANLLDLEKQHPGYLTPEQKKSLDDISDKRTWASYIPFRNDVSKDKLTAMATDSALKPEDLEAQKRGARVDTPVTPENQTPRQVEMAKEGQKEEAKAQELLKKEASKYKEYQSPYPNAYYAAPAAPEADPSHRGQALPHTAEQKNEERAAKITEALKVHKGESYSHSAERLLALAGNSDPSGQQIRDLSRQLQKANHWKHELKVNESLSYADLKNNPALAKIFE